MCKSETHRIAECVHDAIEREYETVKYCMVHVNPVINKIEVT
ncbi:MAG TPA: hypothetical protein DCE48_07710 [Lachnospiraceae bacterium]|nr:cation transporter dimerization domain-containing protein [Anaerosporobacter sp.]HAB60575.1 hypothetical protein [Lachnospiraceae bacterium]